MDRHASEVEELDVEGILAFAERILPRAADLWVQSSPDQRQRFQQLFYPEGIAFDGSAFVGNAATAPAFSDLRGSESWEGKFGGAKVVSVEHRRPSIRRVGALPDEPRKDGRITGVHPFRQFGGRPRGEPSPSRAEGTPAPMLTLRYHAPVEHPVWARVSGTIGNQREGQSWRSEHRRRRPR